MILKSLRPSVTDIILTGFIKLLDYGSVFAVSLILANSLTIKEYGAFVTYERTVFLFASGLLLGQDTLTRKKLSLSKVITNEDIHLVQYSWANTLIIYLFLSLPMFYYFKSGDNGSVVSLFFTGSIIFTFSSFLNGSILIGKKYNWLGNFCRRVSGRIMLLFLIALILLNHLNLNLELVVILFFISSLFQFLLSISLTKFKFKNLRYRIKLKIYSKVLHQSLTFFLIQFSSLFSQQLPFILLTFFGNSEITAKYDVAFKLSAILLIPLNVTSGVVANRFANSFKEGRTEYLNKKLDSLNSVLKIIGILFLTILIAIGDKILTLWGVNYSESYLLLILLGIAQFFNLSFGHLGEIMKMVGLEKKLLYISVGNLTLNAILTLIFAINNNALGIALSFILISILSNYSKLFILRKHSGISTNFFKFKFSIDDFSK